MSKKNQDKREKEFLRNLGHGKSIYEIEMEENLSDGDF